MSFLSEWQSFKRLLERVWWLAWFWLVFKRSLDTIDHEVLLQKSCAVGFSKHEVNWFQFYLWSRLFLVNLRNYFSQSTSVSFCVPQGSIFGSFFFKYIAMTCVKLWNVTFFSMLMIHVLFFNIKMLTKLKIS